MQWECERDRHCCPYVWNMSHETITYCLERADRFQFLIAHKRWFKCGALRSQIKVPDKHTDRLRDRQTERHTGNTLCVFMCQNQQTGDPWGLTDRNGKSCPYALLMWCWWYLDVFLLSAEWMCVCVRETWRSVSPSLYAGRGSWKACAQRDSNQMCGDPCIQKKPAKTPYVFILSCSVSSFPVQTVVSHTHTLMQKSIWNLIYMQTNLTRTCWFSDNYAQVAVIKQVNVNLTQAFI